MCRSYNTVSPKSVFHIDGASTTATGNPATGSVTDALAVDDVVIDNSGNVGIGVWPTFISFYYLTSGDVVSLAINETTASHSNQISDAFLLVELN